jgi:hypothetical protein
MVGCDFTECADPINTIFMVLLAVLHKLLGGLIKGGVVYPSLKDLFEATVSVHGFLQLTLCAKVRCQSLELGNERVRFH